MSQFIGLSVIYPFKSKGIANMHDPIYWMDYHTWAFKFKGWAAIHNPIYLVIFLCCTK